jgi:hypothetical protein
MSGVVIVDAENCGARQCENDCHIVALVPILLKFSPGLFAPILGENARLSLPLQPRDDLVWKSLHICRPGRAARLTTSFPRGYCVA